MRSKLILRSGFLFALALVGASASASIVTFIEDDAPTLATTTVQWETGDFHFGEAVIIPSADQVRVTWIAFGGPSSANPFLGYVNVWKDAAQTELSDRLWINRYSSSFT